MKLVQVEFGIVIEENSCATLSLKLDEYHVGVIRHFLDLELDVSLLTYRHELFLLFLISIFSWPLIDLFFHVEVDAPVSFRNFEILTKIDHLLGQLSQDIFRGHRREEPMRVLNTLLVVFEGQKHRVFVFALCLRKFWVINPAVNLVSHCVSTARLVFHVLFHLLLAVLLLLSELLVGLVSGEELLSNFLFSGELSLLQPWVSNDVGDGEALMGVKVKHGSHQVLELLVEEAFRLAVLMGCPELLRSICCNQFVVGIFHVCHVEGRMASVENEENHTESKQINYLSLVRLLSVNFWGHES